MIALTIIIGILALVAAHSAGLTQTWVGTSAVSAVVLMLAVASIPGAWWLFDSLGGWVTTLSIWAIVTTFYHRLLSESAPMRTDSRRQTPTIELQRRHVIGWQFGRFQVGFAVGVAS